MKENYDQKFLDMSEDEQYVCASKTKRLKLLVDFIIKHFRSTNSFSYQKRKSNFNVWQHFQQQSNAKRFASIRHKIKAAIKA